MTTRKIAILQSKELYNGYDDYERLIERVTEFTEVDDATYELLHKARHTYGFTIIEQPTDQQKFILDTVEAYKKMIIAEEQRKKKEAEAAAQKKLERKLKADLKKKEERLRVYQQLQKEFEEAEPSK